MKAQAEEEELRKKLDEENARKKAEAWKKEQEEREKAEHDKKAAGSAGPKGLGDAWRDYKQIPFVGGHT